MPRDKAKQKVAKRRWYNDHPGYYAERARIRKAELRALVDKAKDVPCVDCGVKYHPAAMDFDHVYGEKLFNISKACVRGVSKAKLIAEIAKCQIRCANCHRIRTAVAGMVDTLGLEPSAFGREGSTPSSGIAILP